MLMRVSRPHVSFLGRIPGTDHYSDIIRHPENEPILGTIIFRPESALMYVNADFVRDAVLTRLKAESVRDIRMIVCDLSASPYIDLAGSEMLQELHRLLTARKIDLYIVSAHGQVRDLLRADGVGDKFGELSRALTLERLLSVKAGSTGGAS